MSPILVIFFCFVYRVLAFITNVLECINSTMLEKVNWECKHRVSKLIFYSFSSAKSFLSINRVKYSMTLKQFKVVFSFLT